MKNIRIFYQKNCQFLVVKFSVYLNRRVFVMEQKNRALPSENVSLGKCGQRRPRSACTIAQSSLSAENWTLQNVSMNGKCMDISESVFFHYENTPIQIY